MRPKRPITKEQKDSLRELLKKTKGKDDFRRVQCLWLRARFGMSSSEVSEAVCWHSGAVRRIQSSYFKRGETALIRIGRGGRRNENLSITEETEFLSAFLEKAKAGHILVIAKIKAAYEKRVGRKVPKSTIYRMLKRNGWRKVAPRPHHPKADAEKQEAFKKTPGKDRR